MLPVPIVARHIEVVQIVHVVVHLRTILWIAAADTWVVMIVMVAIDTVPRNAANLWRVDVPPFCVPLLIILALQTLRVKRITDIDDEFDIPELLHFGQHLASDLLLAGCVGNISMKVFIPTPIADNQEGSTSLVGAGLELWLLSRSLWLQCSAKLWLLREEVALALGVFFLSRCPVHVQRSRSLGEPIQLIIVGAMHRLQPCKQRSCKEEAGQRQHQTNAASYRCPRKSWRLLFCASVRCRHKRPLLLTRR
mmetsp:Transcript_80949/g.203685  ORF Transcript_80949/g.203685 Transcript_80949/m.203685 type:complete len:251 (+) Transcript_80949:677-1429(+)